MTTSTDGSKILIAMQYGNLYSYSTNSGQSWTPVADSYGGGWAGAISGDGTKMIIAERGSKNVATGSGIPRIGSLGGGLSPVTLGSVNVSSYNDWRSVACDSTCTHIILSEAGTGPSGTGGLFTSSDGGATWVRGTNSGFADFSTQTFSAVESNADGSRLVAAVGWSSNKGIYISTDYVVTWTTQGVDTNGAWDGVAISGNGSVIYAQTDGSTTSVARGVFPTSTTTVLGLGSTTLTYGQVETLTATIQAGGVTANTNSGTVSFQNNGDGIGSTPPTL
jgi:hypothetical protein